MKKRSKESEAQNAGGPQPTTKLESLGLGPEDLAWMGSDLNLDVDAMVREHGYDPEGPLDLILGAIIDAHPDEKAPNGKNLRSERLETAKKALIGDRRKRGMDEREDYDLLLQIAWEFFVGYVHTLPLREGVDPPLPDLTPIIKRVIDRLPNGDPRKLASPDSVERRLRRKFNADRDLLLVRVTSERDWGRLDVIRAVVGILRTLAKLGVKAKLHSVGPRFRTMDELPPQ